jgi:transcriptional regulator with XRE-family HTH domain
VRSGSITPSLVGLSSYDERTRENSTVPSEFHYCGIRYRGIVVIGNRPALDLAAVGRRIRAERRARGLTLDRLAASSGVSRSMVSEVERGAKVPTVLVLDRIARALGASITGLLRDEPDAHTTLLRRGEQTVARSEAGQERRVLSPVLTGTGFEFTRTILGPGVDAACGSHGLGSREYVAVETGLLRLSLDDANLTLAPGDSVSYAGVRPHRMANPDGEPCVYYVAVLRAYAATDD